MIIPGLKLGKKGRQRHQRQQGHSYQVSGQHGGLNNYEAFTYLTDHMLLMCVVSMPIYYEAVDNHSVMYM